MSRIDSIIQKIRDEISKVAEDFNSETKDLINFINVVDEKAYNSVIDSFYLLEDTQLAKSEFCKVDFINVLWCFKFMLYATAGNISNMPKIKY